ncbi:DinB family protein [Terriglobus roseus]|nr:DinB family protein [Terriglobus roseus]
MAKTTLESELKNQLKALLDGGQAHAKLDDAVTGIPAEAQGQVPQGLPYSPWQLLEHIRIAQRDILEFSDNTDGTYKEMKWPDDYWPKSPVPPDAHAWDKSVAEMRKDRAAFEKLLAERDLTEPFPWGDGKQNLLREALLIADHESYHTGELIVTRRLLGVWQPKKGHA